MVCRAGAALYVTHAAVADHGRGCSGVGGRWGGVCIYWHGGGERCIDGCLHMRRLNKAGDRNGASDAGMAECAEGGGVGV